MRVAELAKAPAQHAEMGVALGRRLLPALASRRALPRATPIAPPRARQPSSSATAAPHGQGCRARPAQLQVAGAAAEHGTFLPSLPFSASLPLRPVRGGPRTPSWQASEQSGSESLVMAKASAWPGSGAGGRGARGGGLLDTSGRPRRLHGGAPEPPSAPPPNHVHTVSCGSFPSVFSAADPFEHTRYFRYGLYFALNPSSWQNRPRPWGGRRPLPASPWPLAVLP